MAELEDELKVKNWLSIVTFDLYKYIEAGGKVDVEQKEEGITFTLTGIDVNSDGINKKFRRAILSSQVAS